MRSIVEIRVCPSEFATPEYVQVLVYVPQLTVAEKGVIARYWSLTPYYMLNVVVVCATEFTING